MKQLTRRQKWTYGIGAVYVAILTTWSIVDFNGFILVEGLAMLPALFIGALALWATETSGSK